jgi:hypothetical protein
MHTRAQSINSALGKVFHRAPSADSSSRVPNSGNRAPFKLLPVYAFDYNAGRLAAVFEVPPGLR